MLATLLLRVWNTRKGAEMIPPITSMKGAFSLEGQNAIITGGNRGLGLAIAKAFAEQGANCAIFCRNMAKAAEALEELKEIGGTHKAYSCDVTDFESIRKAIAEVYADYEQIDILVNNSGISYNGELLDMDENLTDWFLTLDTDLNGMVRMTYEVGKRMRDAGKGGSIINMTSNAAYMVNWSPCMAAYSSAKAAGNHFTRCMACELAKYDIRVNAIAPGFTTTELAKHIPPEAMDYIEERTVSKRWGEPIEVGALAVYLASPAAAQVTGSVHVIDGGYMLRC